MTAHMKTNLIGRIGSSAALMLTIWPAALGAQAPPTPLEAEPSALRAPAEAARGEVVPAEKVQAYAVPQADPAALAAELQQKFAGRGVRIAPDLRGRQIVVIGPAEVHREVAGAITAALAAGPPAADAEQAAAEQAAAQPRANEKLTLQHLTWKDFEARLFAIWGRRLTATSTEAQDAATFRVPGRNEMMTLRVNRRTGVVSIESSPETAASWLRVIKAIDAPVKAGDDSRVMPLDQADPATVMRAVSLLKALSQPPAPNRRSHIGEFVSMIFQPGGQEVAQPAAGAQPGIQPPPPVPPQPAPGEQPPPGEAVPGQEAPADATSPIGNVQIEIDELTGQIIIRGKQRDVQRVIQMIQEIVRQSQETRPIVEIYPLKYVDSTALSEVITAISSAAFAAQGTVSIQPLTRPNALILIGRKENIPGVIELIQKLDQPTPIGAQLKVFQLKYMSSIDMERTLRQFFVVRPGQGTDLRLNLGTRVLVIAEFRSNSIIVQASPRDMAEVNMIVQKLDVEETPTTSELRVFKLRNALAEELAPALQEAITGQGAGGQQQQQQQPQQQQGGQGGGATSPAIATRPATSLQLLQVDGTGQRLIKSGVLANMRITADTRNNALIVVGPPSAMELMSALIQQLDALPSAEAQIKVFTMTNGDASTLVDMLQGLFNQAQQGGGQGQLPFQSATGSGESTLVPLRFSVDQRTNSIIVTGNPGDLDVIRNILVRLDVPESTQRITTVHRLHNAPAADVALAINNLLTRQRDLNTSAPELVTPYQLIEREILIEPEIVTNSLIVSATPRYFDQVMKIITELDKRPPMVVIQVLLAEVTLTDNEQFGVEWGLQDQLMFDRSIATSRYAFNNALFPNDNTPASLATRQNVGTQALSNLAVGRTDAALGFGGLVLTASNESVNVLLRALEQSSRAQVISRPQVQTLDNQTAYVNVGALVPRITGVTQSTIGTANPSVSDISVGIILEVTPRTSPDGTIVMQINATKSEVGPEATGIPIFTDANGNVIRSPQIPITTAQTIVSARSGQTVVLGGLITNNQIENTQRIPYVADIPVLGRLFRFDTVSNQRTELLLIMTPFIIETPEQNDWLNARETERMSWCIADIVNIHGPVGGLSGNPAFNTTPSDVIFPDLDPSGADVMDLDPTDRPPPGPTRPAPTPVGPMIAPPTVPPPPLPGLDPLLPTPALPTPREQGQFGPQPQPVNILAAPSIGAIQQVPSPPPGDPRLLQPQLIQPAQPPPGTQALWSMPPSGPAPGAVAPAMYQQPVR